MNRKRTTRIASALSCLVVIGALIAGCSAKTPTAPEQVPAPIPNPSPDSWTIEVTIKPSTVFIPVSAGTAEPATVRVRVRRTGSSETPKGGTRWY